MYPSGWPLSLLAIDPRLRVSQAVHNIPLSFNDFFANPSVSIAIPEQNAIPNSNSLLTVSDPRLKYRNRTASQSALCQWVNKNIL